jgi:tetratricopeptide (TPR) repeat protein
VGRTEIFGWAASLVLVTCTFAGAQTSTGTQGQDPQTTSGFGKNANWDQVSGHQHGSLTFSGKVVMSGGALPWDPIPVVVLCDGKPRYNTLADLGGGFRIVATPVASEVSPGKPGAQPIVPTQLIGCKVQAALEGYKSTTLTIANRSMMDDPDIGTITLSGNEKTMGLAQSATTASAPKDARKAFDKARSEASEGHADGAQKDLEKAVHIYPQFAEAWYQLGKLEEAQKPQEAYDAFSKAATADPHYLPTYEHLALTAAQQKKWQEVADATGHALELYPEGTPQIWYFHAAANFNLGHKDIAEKSATTSLAMDPSHVAPNTEQLLAVILASRGDYGEALSHLRNCLTYTPPGPNAELMKQQVAQLEKAVTPAAK